MDINKSIQWNEQVGNKRGDINLDLEAKMLTEEARETRHALWNEDKVEIVDGCIDIIFVAIGTLHKLGLTQEQIEQCWDEVCESNFSKLPFEKGKDGKVKKGKNFKKPNFSFLLL